MSAADPEANTPATNTSPQAPTEGTEWLDELLINAFSDFYEYMYEPNILKAAEEYSTKSIYKHLKAAILAHTKADIQKVDRFEVIDDTGRAYVKGSIYGSPVEVELSYQDDGRTLKVFVSPRGTEGGSKG